MSTYMEISGTIHFKDKETAKKAIDFVVDSDWIRRDDDNQNMGLWISENEGFGKVELDKDYLTFNGGTMRNVGIILRHILEEYDIDKEKTYYRTVCTDGMFALAEYDADIGGSVDVDRDTFLGIVGCHEEDIIYGEDEAYEKDEEWIESNKHRFYSTAYINACDWLTEG